MRLLRLLVIPFVLGFAAAAAASTSAPDVRAFLEDGPGWLLSQEAKAELAAATPDAQARAIAAFLAEADGAVGRAVEARGARWRSELVTPLDGRARLLFVRGEPQLRHVTHCPEILRDVEVWEYALSAEATARRERNVLYRPEGSPVLALWSAQEDETVLYSREAGRWLEDWRAAGRPAKRLDRIVCKQAVMVIDTLELPGGGEGGAKVLLHHVDPPAGAAERAEWRAASSPSRHCRRGPPISVRWRRRSKRCHSV